MFNKHTPLPHRFWCRNVNLRSPTNYAQADKVFIGLTDGVTNAAPQQHFKGIMKHIHYILKIPYVSDNFEVIRGRIASASLSFMITALSMMEAPYLFDDIVNDCCAIASILKRVDHDSLLTNAQAIEDFNNFSSMYYPSSYEMLKDMLRNVKGEDSSALKKFAYTVYGIEQQYHAFQPNLHIKEAIEAKEAGQIIEEYGKIFVGDVSWSAVRQKQKEALLYS